MPNKTSLALIIIMFFCQNIFAQTKIIIKDQAIQELAEEHINFNRNNPKIPGYRIHIYAEDKRQLVMEMREKSMQIFPEIDAYVDYIKPSFKLRLGNYLTKATANKYLKRIKTEFPSAYIVSDNILKTKIIME
jgi:hypothetical protein